MQTDLENRDRRRNKQPRASLSRPNGREPKNEVND